jgi:hypothetical protein
MRISRVDDEYIALTELDLLCCELLHQIPTNAGTDDPAAVQRLFPMPTRGREPDFEEDWRSYVEPGLRQLFQSSLETIRDDLKNVSPAGDDDDDDDTRTLRIPLKHVDAWIHGLNQARLALASRHEFSEEEMEQVMPQIGDDRALALFQVHFYGFLIECFLRQVEESEQ